MHPVQEFGCTKWTSEQVLFWLSKIMYIAESIPQLVLMVFVTTSHHIGAIQSGTKRDLWFVQNSVLCIPQKLLGFVGKQTLL